MKRLIKVAKELNVGISTIVEHLNGSGFSIESKPTAKVTDEMYDALLNKFERSIAIKEKANKLTIGTRPVTQKEAPVFKPAPTPVPPKVESVPTPIPVPIPTPPPAPPVVKEEKVAVPVVEKEVVKEVVKEEPKPTREVPKLKVLGKINLDDKKKGGKKKEEKKKEEAKPATKKEASTPVVEKKEVVAPKTEEKKVATPKEETPKVKKEETPLASQKTDKPVDKVEAPKVEDKKVSAPGMIRAKTPELRGLKILGKIDTDKLKPAKKKKTGTGTGNANSDKRRRRRRKKVVTTGSDSKTTTGGTGTPRPRGTGARGTAGGTRGPARGRRPVARRGAVRGGRRDEVKEITKKEIEEKLKATLARIQGSGKGKKRRQKLRRGNRDRHREQQEQQELEKIDEKLELTEFISVSELASLLDIEVSEVIMTCMNLGVMVSINQRLDAEIIELVAGEFNREVEFISVEEQADDEVEDIDDPEDLSPRSPIVTVMGHVDHGKTSLLDYIRKAAVADGEAGGITQHIGAYEVSVDGQNVTFLDTPGHEAFTAMRARGAKVTDIAIIIIAADDNIMPQTKEAISHAQAADVPMIFAINKIDKDGAQPERIKQELANMNLLIEEWGGKYQSQEISAKTGENIELLIEKILLEAEVLELQANPDRPAVGAVLEASLDKGKGYVTKLLIQNGTLEIGDAILSGEHSGKIKAMYNEHGDRIKTAGPSTPVMILGLSGAPQAGERIRVLDSETEARQIASKRARIVREQTTRATKRLSLDEIGRRLALGSFKELNLIVKGDMDGSIEALSDSLIKLSVETVQVNVIHKAVGQVIESDIMLAAASDAIIVAFQVRPSLGARNLAEREGVEVRTYSVIYQAIDEIKQAIEGLLEPIKEEKITGQVEVREVYKISKVGTIAGCFVREGLISRNSLVRIIRNGIVVYPMKEGMTGEISSLKRFKDDAKEVKTGLECGLSIKNFNDIKAEDVIEVYEIVEIKQTLK